MIFLIFSCQVQNNHSATHTQKNIKLFSLPRPRRHNCGWSYKCSSSPFFSLLSPSPPSCGDLWTDTAFFLFISPRFIIPFFFLSSFFFLSHFLFSPLSLFFHRCLLEAFLSQNWRKVFFLPLFFSHLICLSLTISFIQNRGTSYVFNTSSPVLETNIVQSYLFPFFLSFFLFLTPLFSLFQK